MERRVAEVYVAAGSNVEPQRHLRQALDALTREFGAVRASRAYRNRAVGFEGPDFINLVVGFDTYKTLPEVIEVLRSIETECGRARLAPKWEPRSMDLDVLLYGSEVRSTADYTIPRPDLLKRPYMLAPLAEIAPQLKHPTAGITIAELWAQFDPDAHAMTEVRV